MIIDGVLSLKTDETLLRAVKRAAARGLNADEVMEQRISFVYGAMSSRESVTKEQVRQAILEQQGGHLIK